MGNPVRYNCRGTIFHTVPRSNNEEIIFKDDESRRYYLTRLKEYCRKMLFSLYCYCLMNTHPHLLLEQLGDVSISELMQVLNTSYAMFLNKRFRRHGRVFCCKYKTNLVDSDAYLLEVSRYIHNNPVKAGLVRKPEEYKWSSYRYYIGLTTSNFINKQEILNIIDPVPSRQVELYKKFVTQG